MCMGRRGGGQGRRFKSLKDRIKMKASTHHWFNIFWYQAMDGRDAAVDKHIFVLQVCHFMIGVPRKPEEFLQPARNNPDPPLKAPVGWLLFDKRKQRNTDVASS